MDTAISSHITRRRRNKTVLACAALLATISLTAWGINRAVSPSVDANNVSIATVRVGNIANSISASGIVIPVHEELVSSPIQTRVAKVHAKLGQQVQSGEMLLELDSRTIVLAIDALKEQLAQQENRILALTLELEQKRKQLVGAIELLQLDLEAARVKLGRYQTLRKAGGVSAEDLLTAELNVKRIEIQLRQHHEQQDDNKRVTGSNIEGARLQKSILQKLLVEQGNVRLNGEVQTVLPEIQNGTVKLLVTLREPHHAMLRNKLRVEVNILTEQKQNTLLADAGPAFW